MKKKNPEWQALVDEIEALWRTIFAMHTHAENMSNPSQYKYLENLRQVKIERIKTIPEYIEE